jgi:hypothetical protein
MGARPVFSLDCRQSNREKWAAYFVSLRFGPIHNDTEPHKWNRSRLAGVLSGIAHYGNSAKSSHFWTETV